MSRTASGRTPGYTGETTDHLGIEWYRVSVSRLHLYRPVSTRCVSHASLPPRVSAIPPPPRVGTPDSSPSEERARHLLSLPRSSSEYMESSGIVVPSRMSPGLHHSCFRRCLPRPAWQPVRTIHDDPDYNSFPVQRHRAIGPTPLFYNSRGGDHSTTSLIADRSLL